MASSLSNLFNNFAEGILEIKLKYEHDDKKCETCGIKHIDCNCFLAHTKFKDNLIEYKCLCCDKNNKKKFDEKIMKQFFNTYRFCNHDINKFVLLLLKSVYPYECIGDWEKFNETLPEKEDF